MTSPQPFLDAAWIKRAISRIAQEIVEWNHGPERLVIVGLQPNGVTLGRRIADVIREHEGAEVPVGSMDITLYRDDVGTRAGGPHLPSREGTRIPVDIHEKIVVLVDDVLNTGRSTRAALDHLMDLGRPQKIQLAGLIDRGGRELPIRPDFVGRKVTVGDDELVRVRLAERDEADEVVVVAKGTPR
jgi:pyrimidine operon attenuation protein/uracil phosphoribosyltransferase